MSQIMNQHLQLRLILILVLVAAVAMIVLVPQRRGQFIIPFLPRSNLLVETGNVNNSSSSSSTNSISSNNLPSLQSIPIPLRTRITISVTSNTEKLAKEMEMKPVKATSSPRGTKSSLLRYPSSLSSSSTTRTHTFPDNDNDENGNDKECGTDNGHHPCQHSLDKFRILNMTLCQGKCRNNCKTYLTPMSICYSPKILFPNDPSWSTSDVLDELLRDDSVVVGNTEESSVQSFQRTIFSESKNTTCTTTKSIPNDVFTIPLNECVGPFDQPRPWGIFALI